MFKVVLRGFQRDLGQAQLGFGIADLDGGHRLPAQAFKALRVPLRLVVVHLRLRHRPFVARNVQLRDQRAFWFGCALFRFEDLKLSAHLKGKIHGLSRGHLAKELAALHDRARRQLHQLDGFRRVGNGLPLCQGGGGKDQGDEGKNGNKMAHGAFFCRKNGAAACR